MLCSEASQDLSAIGHLSIGILSALVELLHTIVVQPLQEPRTMYSLWASLTTVVVKYDVTLEEQHKALKKSSVFLVSDIGRAWKSWGPHRRTALDSRSATLASN